MVMLLVRINPNKLKEEHAGSTAYPKGQHPTNAPSPKRKKIGWSINSIQS